MRGNGYNSTMTEQNTTSSNATTEATAKSRSGSGLFWLIVVGGTFIGGIWALESGFLDMVLQTEEEFPRPVETRQESISAQPSPANNEIFQLLQEQKHTQKLVETQRRELRRLDERLQQLAQQMETLAKTTASAAMQGPAVIQNGENAAAVQSGLQQLEQRLESLQADYQRNTRRYAARLELSRLADELDTRLREGVAYEDYMPRLRKLARESGMELPALDTLAPYASEGVPTLAGLLDRFDETLELALPVSLSRKETSGFGEALRQRLSHIVTIRRVDIEPTDDSDEAHLARTENELQMGNVELALTHLQQTSGTVYDLFAPWRQQAKIYLAVQDAVKQLKAAALQPIEPSYAESAAQPEAE